MVNQNTYKPKDTNVINMSPGDPKRLPDESFLYFKEVKNGCKAI